MNKVKESLRIFSGGATYGLYGRDGFAFLLLLRDVFFEEVLRLEEAEDFFFDEVDADAEFLVFVDFLAASVSAVRIGTVKANAEQINIFNNLVMSEGVEKSEY